MKKLIFSRFGAIHFLLLTAIFFHANSTYAQHPCDTFGGTTCTVPGSLETWTISDNNSIATGQTGDDFTTQIGSHDPNMKTLWYRWTAPNTRVYVVDTKGTNTNGTATIPVLDTTIKITTGGTLPTNTTFRFYNQDWNGVSECNQYTTTLRGTEHIRSSCLILYAVAGTTYNFQVDGQNDCCSFPTSGAFLLNMRPLIEPTSSSVSVSGRTLDVNGNVISGVAVRLTKPNGEILTRISNSFGNYLFEAVESGQTYILEANKKRFLFQNSPRALFVNGSLQDQNLIGTETPD